MRDIVPASWLAFTGPLEGAAIPYPYADIYNLITIAYGNLIDPVSVAMGLPFVFPDGRAARGDEIAAAFSRVKNDPKCARLGHLYAKQLTTIRLTPEGITRLVFLKLHENDAILAKRIPGWEDLNACTQCAMHSLAWACGANVQFPQLFKAIAAGDFASFTVDDKGVEHLTGGAAFHIHMNTDGPDRIPNTADDNNGLKPRNAENAILMRNAAYVQGAGLDPDLLEWRRLLCVTEAVTQPELPDPPSSAEPVLEDDGGASREQATFDAVDELAKNRG